MLTNIGKPENSTLVAYRIKLNFIWLLQMAFSSQERGTERVSFFAYYNFAQFSVAWGEEGFRRK